MSPFDDFFFFKAGASLYSLGWPGTPIHLPVPASRGLRLKVHVTKPSLFDDSTVPLSTKRGQVSVLVKGLVNRIL